MAWDVDNNLPMAMPKYHSMKDYFLNGTNPMIVMARLGDNMLTCVWASSGA